MRNEQTPHAATPQWSGNPAPASDGTLSALVTYTPAPSGTNYFAVVAVNGAGVESELSGELPTGTPHPCRVDSCSTKSACDFGNRVDGTFCDATFCSDPEACLGGDVVDPCPAAVCVQGGCAAAAGTELIGKGLRLRDGGSRIKLTAKGAFAGDPSVDPSLSGMVLELRAADGSALHASSIAAEDFSTVVAGRHYRFVAPRSGSDPLQNGLTRVDLRRKGAGWLVTAKAVTPALMAAFAEPTLTWVIRLGASCARRLDMPCDQKTMLSSCR